MNRMNGEIGLNGKKGIISKRKEELDKYKNYVPNNTPKQKIGYGKIVFNRYYN